MCPARYAPPQYADAMFLQGPCLLLTLRCSIKQLRITLGFTVNFPKLTSVIVLCGLLSALYAPSADAVTTYRGRGTYVTLLSSNIKSQFSPRNLPKPPACSLSAGSNRYSSTKQIIRSASALPRNASALMVPVSVLARHLRR